MVDYLPKPCHILEKIQPALLALLQYIPSLTCLYNSGFS